MARVQKEENFAYYYNYDSPGSLFFSFFMLSIRMMMTTMTPSTPFSIEIHFLSSYFVPHQPFLLLYCCGYDCDYEYEKINDVQFFYISFFPFFSFSFFLFFVLSEIFCACHA